MNVQSLGVPQYNAHDNTFTTIYPMLCGGGVEALPGAGGVARSALILRESSFLEQAEVVDDTSRPIWPAYPLVSQEWRLRF